MTGARVTNASQQKISSGVGGNGSKQTQNKDVFNDFSWADDETGDGANFNDSFSFPANVHSMNGGGKSGAPPPNPFPKHTDMVDEEDDDVYEDDDPTTATYSKDEQYIDEQDFRPSAATTASALDELEDFLTTGDANHASFNEEAFLRQHPEFQQHEQSNGNMSIGGELLSAMMPQQQQQEQTYPSLDDDDDEEDEEEEEESPEIAAANAAAVQEAVYSVPADAVSWEPIVPESMSMSQPFFSTSSRDLAGSGARTPTAADGGGVMPRRKRTSSNDAVNVPAELARKFGMTPEGAAAALFGATSQQTLSVNGDDDDDDDDDDEDDDDDDEDGYDEEYGDDDDLYDRHEDDEDDDEEYENPEEDGHDNNSEEAAPVIPNRTRSRSYERVPNRILSEMGVVPNGREDRKHKGRGGGGEERHQQQEDSDDDFDEDEDELLGPTQYHPESSGAGRDFDDFHYVRPPASSSPPPSPGRDTTDRQLDTSMRSMMSLNTQSTPVQRLRKLSRGVSMKELSDGIFKNLETEIAEEAAAQSAASHSSPNINPSPRRADDDLGDDNFPGEQQAVSSKSIPSTPNSTTPANNNNNNRNDGDGGMENSTRPKGLDSDVRRRLPSLADLAAACSTRNLFASIEAAARDDANQNGSHDSYNANNNGGAGKHNKNDDDVPTPPQLKEVLSAGAASDSSRRRLPSWGIFGGGGDMIGGNQTGTNMNNSMDSPNKADASRMHLMFGGAIGVASKEGAGSEHVDGGLSVASQSTMTTSRQQQQQGPKFMSRLWDKLGEEEVDASQAISKSNRSVSTDGAEAILRLMRGGQGVASQNHRHDSQQALDSSRSSNHRRRVQSADNPARHIMDAVHQTREGMTTDADLEARKTRTARSGGSVDVSTRAHGRDNDEYYDEEDQTRRTSVESSSIYGESDNDARYARPPRHHQNGKRRDAPTRHPGRKESARGSARRMVGGLRRSSNGSSSGNGVDYTCSANGAVGEGGKRRGFWSNLRKPWGVKN